MCYGREAMAGFGRRFESRRRSSYPPARRVPVAGQLSGGGCRTPRTKWAFARSRSATDRQPVDCDGRTKAGRSRRRRGNAEGSPRFSGKAQAVRLRAPGRKVEPMSKFFINRPIVAMVISIVMVIRRGHHDFQFTRCPISEYRAAGNSDPGHLRREPKRRHWSNPLPRRSSSR